MRSRLALGVAGALALVATLLATDAAATSTPSTTGVALYAASSVKVHVHDGTDWRATVAVPLSAGWTVLHVSSPVEATCWYVGAAGVSAWPDAFGSSGTAGYVVDVLAASVQVQIKCANGHGAGPVFVTATPVSEQGTP